MTLGAEGQGMVAGDLVNTASRIQSAAEPGTVLVGEATKRATEAAIAYDDAGEHELEGQGRAGPAVARAAGGRRARGARSRSAGLEAPFVGRDRELRLVKELFHASADEQRAQLVSVAGIAGIGKSRLSWEFEKYIDGLADDACWHRGRCLSYGEGVAYWALAEMVRMRCGIVEDEEPESRAGEAPHDARGVRPDAEERALGRAAPRPPARARGGRAGRPGEPLLGLADPLRAPGATQSPTILVFEDLQWADAGLLDFLEYLLDWSRSHPLFVLALARPELADKRPGWGAGKRSFTSLYLEPLSAAAMGELLDGLVPGLPDDLRDRILDRAEGVPLYAVETVRMLLDRGLLAREGNVYRPTGADRGRSRCPRPCTRSSRRGSTACRPRSAAWSQDGAVLGKTFTKQGLAAVSGVRGERARAAARRPAAQGDALGPGRPPLARARAVRVPAGHRQARRLRDDLETRAQGASTWRPRSSSPRPGAPRRTRSSRSSPRTTSTPTTPRRRTPTPPS